MLTRAMRVVFSGIMLRVASFPEISRTDVICQVCLYSRLYVTE